MMHYDRAPIREAILALEGILPSERMALLHAFLERIHDDYPNCEPHYRYSAAFAPGGPGGPGSAQAVSTQDGFLCRSVTSPQIVQARLDGLFFSRLQPYERWENFVAEARRVWALYQETIQEFQVQSIGVRYINQIPIPNSSRLDTYFNIFPETRPDCEIQNYFMRLEIPRRDVNAVAIIQQGPAPSTRPDELVIILDIDLRMPRDSAVPLWDQIDRIRPVKNQIFEDCITDITRERINAIDTSA